MKRASLNFLSLLMCMIMLAGMAVIPAGAEKASVSWSGETYGDFSYDVNGDNTVTVTGYIGSEKDIVIPEKIDDMAVTSIDDSAFEECGSIISITIPDGVVSIGNYAFYDCESLTSVNIPDGVVSLGQYAFYGCSSLETLVIPESVTSEKIYISGCTSLTSITIPAGITEFSFSSWNPCKSLKEIIVSENNPNYCSVDGVLYNKEKTELIYYPMAKADTYVIPEGVTSIGGSAFANCGSLTSVTIPEGVASIGGSAFEDCSSLADITLPESVISIGSSAFEDCSSLTSITIPNGVTSIGRRAFDDCTALTSITLPESLTSIEPYTFWYCSSLTSVVIPKNVVSIGEYAFDGCKTLTNVEISNGVTSIGQNAFRSCRGLTSVTLPDSVEFVDKSAFDGCENLTAINVSDNNPNYKSVDGVLYNKEMTELVWLPTTISGDFVIPDGIVSIDNKFFYNCTSLTSITVPESVQFIENGSFETCSSLEKINVSESNPNYCSADGVLYNKNKTAVVCCPREQSGDFVIPESVTAIEEGAFYCCSDLTSISVPESVSSIGAYAFYYCSGVEEINIPNGVPSIGSYTFYSCYNLTRAIIPDSVKSIGWGAFLRCSKLADVYISQGLTSVGVYAFDNTEYFSKIEPNNDGLIIDQGVLFEAPSDAVSITVPVSVRVVADGVFKSEALESIEFLGECYIYDDAFTYYCKPKSLTFAGNLLPGFSVPSSVTKLIYTREQLSYQYGDSEENKVHLAVNKDTVDSAIEYTTYSDRTSYNNGFIGIDTVQEVVDNSGNVYAVCGYRDTAVLVPESDTEGVYIHNDGFIYGAAEIDENNNLYIMWGRSISDSDIEQALADEDENIVVYKYDLQGNVLGRCGIPISTSAAQFPFSSGNANILVKDNILGCFFNTQWTKSGDGYHHQGSEFAAININTMELVTFDSWEGSHSFGLSMIPTEYGFAAIQMGDAYARGINFNSYYVSGDEIKFNYLGENGDTVLFNSSGQYGSNAQHLDGNTTYTHMGGLAKSRTTYAAAGKASRVYTSDIYYNSDLKTDIYDVFVKIADQTLVSDVNGLAGTERIDEANGEIADRNVVWLTECSETEKAGQVKVVTLKDGSYCVLWEKFINGVFDSVRYVILDECGNIIRNETKIENARLSDTSVQPVVRGDTLTWAVADATANTLTWYSVDLNSFTTEDEIYAPVKAFAESNNLEFALTEGCYGICGKDMYWVYLEDSGTLLIYAGTPTVSGSGTAPWDKYKEQIKTVIMSDNITDMRYKFEGYGSLEKVKLSDSLTRIGESAFEDCTSLTDISIPNAVTSIGRYAFERCTSLTDVSIPNAVTSIERYAFYDCSSLKSIVIPESVTEIDDYAFYLYRSFTIYGKSGSYAETFASEHYYVDFVAFNSWIWDGYTSASFVLLNSSNEVQILAAQITSERTEPSCEEDGKTVYTANAVFEGECYTDTKTEVLDKLEHSYRLTGWNWDGYTQAEAVFTCENDSSHVQSVKAEISSERTEPTCYYDGEVIYTAAAEFNGEYYTDTKTETLDSHGHSFILTDWKWYGYADAAADFICENCSCEQTIYAVVDVERTEPTCEDDGKIVSTATIELDGKSYTDTKTEILDSVGHIYTLAGWEWDGYTNAAANFTCMNDNTHTIKVDAEITSEITEPTCTDSGYIIYTAKVYTDGNLYTDTKLELLEPLGHSFVHGICTRCGEADPLYFETDSDSDSDDNTDTDIQSDTDTSTDTGTDTETDTQLSDTDTESDTDTAYFDSDTDSEDSSDRTDTDDTDRPNVTYKLGDVDGDGKITAKDSMLIQRYVINIKKLDDTQLKAADVNGDGKVTNKDAMSILRFSIGFKVEGLSL